MPVYYINSYDITDPETFSQYPPIVRRLLQKYDAEILASDVNGLSVEGLARKMNAIIKFPSKEAALNCYNDPEYQPAKAIRQRSTANCTMVIVEAYSPQ